MEQILPKVGHIMNTSLTKDSIAVIKLIAFMNKSGLTPAKKYLPKLFQLIFSKKEETRNEVMRSFITLYIDGRSE